MYPIKNNIILEGLFYVTTITSFLHEMLLVGRFLEFRRCHNFANLFSKLSESTFHKEISKFQQKV